MFEVTTFYRFVELDRLEALRDELKTAGRDAGLCGIILLAAEGINSTIAGEPSSLRAFMEALKMRQPFNGLTEKISTASRRPFHRFKVRIKKEIVTLGAGDLDPARNAGQRVPAREWNALISEPDVVVIDTRNAYETGLGKFPSAIDPDTSSFREFPSWAKSALDPEKHPRVAMYCTGGIRCEKATALLKKEGFRDVYHLEGGILKYLEDIPPDESLWQGECFVFDSRVGLRPGLAEGEHILCAGCRRPLSPDDLDHPDHEDGVGCRFCIRDASESAKAGRRERHKQMKLAAARGRTHLGPRSGPSAHAG